MNAELTVDELHERIQFLEEQIVKLWHTSDDNFPSLHDALGFDEAQYTDWLFGRAKRRKASDEALREKGE